MTPEAQRIAIATACGWKIVAPGRGYTPDGTPGGIVPGYPNDLNACAEMEKFRWLNDLEKLHNDPKHYSEWKMYQNLLKHDVHAPAERRCVCFLKVTKLWKY